MSTYMTILHLMECYYSMEFDWWNQAKFLFHTMYYYIRSYISDEKQAKSGN